MVLQNTTPVPSAGRGPEPGPCSTRSQSWLGSYRNPNRKCPVLHFLPTATWSPQDSSRDPASSSTEIR
ncbi:hypothetical protein AGOR_G00196400 [Albula goreensis]|uniref:Uncharacterized protein n=1 Tax=Albula goreensis TaxID=1534307 RepID=A0A8T3CRB8_9TELE|nr:hypothetical protein AGOR_G00196400 [Albula goreensis]